METNYTYEDSKGVMAEGGYPQPLDEYLESCRVQGFTYAEAADWADFMRFPKGAIRAWIAGRKMERKAPGMRDEDLQTGRWTMYYKK